MVNRDVCIFLCSKTNIMAKPWAEAGYQCYCVDVQHSIRRDRAEQVGQSGGTIHYVWGDVRSWLPPIDPARIAFMFAFPPCTHLSLSGARDYRKKAGWCLADALQIFDSCMLACRYSGAPFGVENPKSRLSTHRRAPDHKFQPWNYGDLWLKETWLWTGNGFKMPPFLHASQPDGVTAKIWLASPSDDRADIRSETPPGFARAVYEANRP